MLRFTLQEYKKTYKSRLSDYLDDYEDNTPDSFLENELKYFNDYCNKLKFILDNLEKVLNRETKDKFYEDLYLFLMSTIKIDNKTKPKPIIKPHNYKIRHNNILEKNWNLSFKKVYIKRNITKIITNEITSTKRIIDFINYEKFKFQKLDFLEKQKILEEIEENIKSYKKEESVYIDEIDYTKSTIENCLLDIKNYLYPDQYKTLVDALYHYFTKGKFPKLEHKIMFKRVNKKKVGWALKEVYMNLKTDNLSTEYFRFAKDNINLFEKEEIVSINFNKSKFYKYFTTTPPK